MVTQPSANQKTKSLRQPLWKMFLPVVGVTLSLAFIALIYFGYDIAKGSVSPCDSIFQQTTQGLTAKIEFLKTKGELKLGASKVAELNDRAQMTALSLKTCCTVLDAGRINPEQFLECKAKARGYDDRIEEIATLVRAALPAAETANAAGTSPSPPPASTLAASFEAALTVSKELNTQVVQVAAEQELKVLKSTPAVQLKVDAQEREPNDDGLSSNVMDLNTQVKAAIASARDADVFTFTTPKTHRDWIRIEVINQSATLEPNLQIFDTDKANIGAVSNTTAGGNVSYEFVGQPSTTYSLRVASHYGSAVGLYHLRVLPRKLYDAHEPNADILSAKTIDEGSAIKAGIMDKNDIDYFVVRGEAAAARPVTVTIKNASATLHPHVTVYDAGKTQIGVTSNTTPGGDLTYTLNAPKGPIYLRVADHYSSAAGDYSLTLVQQ